MYSPKIKERYIPILYRIAKKKNIPMTRVVNQNMGDYLANCLAKELAERRANGQKQAQTMDEGPGDSQDNV